ncbi:MAG: SDR family oxidoreductase [Burkholderiales bacterium]|nr:SDR family oxidoreductase [Opitutaceae bacterium]
MPKTTRPRPLLVLITGASQGLGEALALAYAKRHPGAKLALVARNAANLEAVAERCARLGADAHGFVCDATDDAAVSRLPAAVSKIFRRAPDIVINNAGRFTPATFADTTAAIFDDMIAANLRSAWLVTRAFLPALQTRGAGDLVFISSICGETGLPGCAAYTMAKHGLTGLAAALRAETKGSGLRVLAIHPGAIETPIWKGSGVPSARLMTPASVAEAVVALTALDANTVAETLTLRPGPGDF